MTPTNNNSSQNSPVIIFRKEQEEAIEQTLKGFQRSRKILWNAKMRFGKTLCALEVAHRLGYKRTLILTHRPAVRTEWFEALRTLGFTNWLYGGKFSSPIAKAGGKSYENLEEICTKDKNMHYIYFASMQDLRGSKRVNPTKGTSKNDNIFNTKWDLLIIDEAHEGITTKLGQDVITELQKRKSIKTLYLSGTPYNIQSLFDTNDVYHWDYCMEQRAKETWNDPNIANPYVGLARLNIITYNISKEFKKFHMTETDGFNFSEFFRTEDIDVEGQNTITRFVHEKEIRTFLSLLSKSTSKQKFPYKDKELASCMNHTLWYLPGVKSAYCLEQLLKEDRADNFFKDYTVVNVAGNLWQSTDRSDSLERTRYEKDSLERVKNAICNNSKTITLSCGRLTMGVSVPEWTAVLMLAGSETGVARYFQTIFRCQSPYKDGNIKKECYAIDFSPRRTLAIVDQYINNSVYKGSHEDRIKMLNNFLHYCPLKEIANGETIVYNPERFIRNVNIVYSENLIRNGFRSDCLYGNLDNLKQQDIKLLDQVATAISQGMAAERKQTRDRITSKRKKAATTKTPSIHKDENNVGSAITRLSPRQRAIAILSQISMRFPLMIYGTISNIDGLTLDSFIRNIDQESWNEFMPKGVSIKLFQRIKHFYREDVFVATAKAIVERLQKADTLPVNERVNEIADILSDFCYPDRETVLTPWKVVNRQYSDTVGGYCFFDEKFEKLLSEPRFVYNGDATEKVFMNMKSHILDLCSKTGLYSLFAAYSIYKLRSSQSQGLFDILTEDEQERLWKKIVEENIFAVCKTHMARQITHRTLAGFKTIDTNILEIPDLTSQVIVYKKKLIKTICDGVNVWKKNNIEKMKFDAIICNPPYQVNIGEIKDNYGIPLYNHFVDVARNMQPNYISMIIPSRWFTGGRGLDSFRQSMLTDKHISAIYDFVDSKDCFPTVDISGGIGYFIWDSQHKSECKFTTTFHGKSNTRKRELNEFPIFVRNNNALSIIHKVKNNKNGNLSQQISGQTPFGFVTTYRGTADKSEDGSTLLLKSSGQSTWVEREEVKKNSQWIDYYKVIFSKATCEHAGTPDRNGMYRVLSSVAILPPGTICTQSYLVAGVYKNETEACNLVRYLKTKFVRYLVLQTITSQDLSPEKFIFIPTQDFSTTSDISWSDDIEEVCRQLYVKYDISDEEIELVDSTIKPM